MNVLATRRILDRRFTHTGIIAADFPGRGVIDGTITLNFPEDFIGKFKSQQQKSCRYGLKSWQLHCTFMGRCESEKYTMGVYIVTKEMHI
ncbi:hypothetical protein [Bacillus thuringiensis]|uniref:hypothetical protein n=1 Tax=Bacillus thuringiensis TaxID=1428 RepID=UPI002D7E8C63|nr:hypothetical protein [Bacillus thuringiensis]MEB4815739.1 hypothetical protein [Bacillus thuringiensis]